MSESNPQPQPEPSYTINEHIVKARVEELKLEQNLGLGIIGGSVGGFLGAVIWAAITYFTEYQIGWLAVGVGFLVGFGVSRLGKGIDTVFGISGGIIALISVMLGNFLASLGFLAKVVEMSYMEVLLGFNYGMSFELLKETFSLIDLLFYAIAVYAGYRYSFRRITRAQLLEGAIIETRQG